MDAPVVAASSFGLRSLKLNRPKALNALNLEMIELMRPKLEAWEESKDCNVVLLKSEGRAFCAGGDVVALVKAAKDASTRQQSVGYFEAEYSLDKWIARMTTPVVAFVNGLTLGGGIGLSGHAPFRIATENTKMAMPETTIGLFPDVGASFLLPRLDGKIGLYLGLTSEQVDGWTAYQIGIASHYVPASRLGDLEERLAHLERPENEAQSHAQINSAINEFAIDSQEASKLNNQLTGLTREAIDHCFSADTVEGIIAALQKVADGSGPERLRTDELKEWAKKTIATMELRSPTSCKMTLEALRRGRRMNVEEVFDMDMRMASACVDPTVAPDFVTGVTERLIEKKPRDSRPAWQPATFADISVAEVKRIFFDKPAPMELPVPKLGPSPPNADPPILGRAYSRYSLPSEDEIKKAVTGEAPYDSSSFAPTEKDVVKLLSKKFGGKVGMQAKVADVVARKCRSDSEGCLSWTPVVCAGRLFLTDAAAKPVEPSPIASTSKAAYPFATGVVTAGDDRAPIALDRLKRPTGLGTSVLQYANARLVAAHQPVPAAHLGLFDRKSADRVRPGDVLEVSYYSTSAKTATTRFSGVLIAIKRRGEGMATSFTLRNIVHKTGVELRFALASPMIAKIGVLMRVADRKVFPKRRSAKLYNLRDNEHRFNIIVNHARQQLEAARQRRERAARLQVESTGVKR